MITKVRLKNWRSHLDSELDFSLGTNALLGSLGSGKTSVLDGICFGLFGTFPNLQMKKLKLDDVIMRKPIEKNRAEIEIEFQIDSKTYSVKRVIEKRKGTTLSEIRENGKLLESPNSQRVTEIIEQILKVDYELFSKAIYSEQNALDYFLTIPKGQRMKRIDELLTIDKFEKSRANTVTLTNRISDRKLGIESIVGQIDEEELKKNISNLDESVKKLVLEKEEQEKTLAKTIADRKRIESELQALQKIKESLELLKRDEKGLDSALEEISKTAKSLEEATRGFSKDGVERSLQELAEFMQRLNQELKQERESYEKIFSEISQAKSKITFLQEEKISSLEPSVKEKLEMKKQFDHLLSLVGGNIEEQLEKKKKDLEKLTAEISATDALISDLNLSIRHLSSAESKCPVCDSILTSERRNFVIKQKQDQIKKLQEKFDESTKEKEKASQALRDLEEAARKITEMFIQIKDLESAQKDLEDSKKVFLELGSFVTQTEGRLSEMKEKIERMERQIKDGEEKRRRYEILLIQLKDYNEKMQRSQELAKEIDEIRVKIRETEYKLSGKDLSAMEEEFKFVIGKEKEIETRLQSYEIFIQEKEVRKQEYEEKLKDLEKQRKEIKKLENLIKDLRTFGFALEQTQIELRGDFIGAVNSSMNKLWETLYPYQDFVAIRLNVEEGDYTLQLKTRGGIWINVEGVASGGERSIAALCLRIAFSLVLAPQIQLLILDEPTHNLDERSVMELAKTLRERAIELVQQIFIITHESKLEDAVTGSLYRLERDKEKDGVTRIISLNQ